MLEMEGDDFYTVIPTAPEDLFDAPAEMPSSPILHRKSLASPIGYASRLPNSNKAAERNGSRASKEGSRRKDGLPSHAFSRNYYCRFCSFNTTKSKVHLYHLVDVHGVDYKIFSCDRCDYASRWKCKVIRHRKMIHKINEPKFEPEMHDSRIQTGKRPPPVLQTQRAKSPAVTDDSAALNTQPVAARQLPSFIQPFSQHPSQQIAGQPINPFSTTSQRPLESQLPALTMREETAKHTPSGSLGRPSPSSSRRKQRKPLSVRKVVRDGADEVYEDRSGEEKQDVNLMEENKEEEEKSNTDDADPLLGLFGGVDDSSTEGILSGPSWRRKLMPTAVTMTTGPSGEHKRSSSPASDEMAHGRIPQNNNNVGMGALKPSLSQMSMASSHSNQSNTDTGQAADDNSMDEQLQERNVEEIIIDDEPHFRCIECNFISKYKWKTMKHYKANHSSSKMFNCSSCNYSTMSRVDYFGHKATHSPRGMHRCDECSYIASSKTNLDRHMVNHRQTNPFKCLYCSFSSTGEAATQRHMAEHHDQSEMPITARHQQHSDMEDSQDEGAVNGEGEFNCELCGYTARNWSKMKEHMIRHSEGTPFACSYCDSKYKRPADLNRHLKIKHNTCLADIGLDGPTLKGVMGPSYGSALDDSVGTEGTAMKRAYQSGDTSMGLDSDGDDEPKRLCIDEDGLSLQCNKCSYIAKWRSDLERHMKVHSEEKRFGCPVCFKSYKYQGDLNVHMRKSHAAGHIRSPKQGSQMAMPPSMCKTPPPNVQVLSNEVIVNMSHAAIVNPLANLGTPVFQVANERSTEQYQARPSNAPQMPMLKPAPTVKTMGKEKSAGIMVKEMTRLNTDGKPIKKGELDPATMVHVQGGEFKCVNCRYETNFKSHLDAHMRLHPEKPFHCKFCTYASYWRGDTKKHIEKNHPEKLPDGVNPYNLVEQVFEEAVRNSLNRSNPLPEIHNVPAKADVKSDKGMIWTPPSEDVGENTGAAAKSAQPKIPTLQASPPIVHSPSTSNKSSRNKEDGHTTHVQCPHCNYNTTSESRLNAHMATHYNLKIFKCPDCGKRANWKWDIQKHMRTDHIDCIEEVIVMDTVEAKETLDEYLKQHPEQRGKPKIGVSADFKPEHWPKPRVRSTNNDMTSSSKTTSIRPFRCSVCSRRSNWKCDIRKHYRQVHPGMSDAKVELMTREELLQAGEKEDDVEQHYPEMKNSKLGNAMKPFRCSLCGKNSKWKWDVAKHIKMVHRGVAEAHVIEDEDFFDGVDSDPGTPDAPHTDGDGDSNFSQSPSSRITKSVERSSPDPNPRPAAKNGPKIGSFQCSICSQFSEFMWVIRRHIRALHPDNPEAKIVDLSSKGEEASHSDSRPYICSLCGKRSNWKWDVKKHILSVHRGCIGSILDELLNKETVIYTDGKTMEVDDGNTKQKIAEIQSHIKEEGSIPRSLTPTPTPTVSSSNNTCYSSLPTMVGLQSAVAPTANSIKPKGRKFDGRSHGKMDNGSVKFKCGYCFFASASRNETVRHVRAEHDGKILRIQTLNKTCRDEQTTYKAAHKSSTTSNSYSMWQCSHCSFKHLKKEEALMHIAQHDLYNAYQCAVCDFADDMEYTLHKHIKAKHEIDQVEDVLLQNIVYAPCVEEVPPAATPANNTGVMYTCNQCEMKTAWRSAIVRHIKEKHIIEGDIHSMFTKHGSNKPDSSPTDHNRRYNCSHCPYKTDKVSMFNEHVERHTTPKSEMDLKCSYCNYWVSANRLLHQHMKLHQQDSSVNGDENSRESKSDKYLQVSSLLQCTECPYRGKAKDLNAHRKLHKQRAGAVYKCPECPYWVNHNRLLQQHVKVHSPRYRQKVFTGSLNLGDTSLDDVAAFKQHLISNQVAPVKLEAAESADKLKRKLHVCAKCPFASSQPSVVEKHALSHGAFSENSLKCKFCDFYCESREMMAQHIKVHSLQYQGEIDDCTLNEDIKNNLSEEGDVAETIESEGGFSLRYTSKDMILEKEKKGLASRRYCCEKCPYASALRENFRRHSSLHASKQGYTCAFCDYSVPSEKLLLSHEVLHQHPNRNLLATQSIMNLTKLKPIPADVQLAQSTELQDGTVTSVHDHMTLYEHVDNAEHSGRSTSMDEEAEPEFIDLAELGSKVKHNLSSNEMGSEDSNDTGPAENGDDEFEMEDGEEVWICRYCDRAFDSESELTSHEQHHR